MSEPTVWTDADQAELEGLIWGLVEAASEHRARCAACNGAWWCQPMNDALQAVLDWRRGRKLLSRAAKARRRELATRLRTIQAELAKSRAAA